MSYRRKGIHGYDKHFSCC